MNMDKKQEFLKRLLATFKIEAEENISGMSADLIELEKNPNDELKAELIEIIFRAAHSLKGASRAVNLSEIESVCQSFESVMSALKNASIDLKPEIFDVLHQTVDIIKDILNLSEEGVNDELAKRISNVIKNLSVIAIGKFEEIILSKPDTNLSAVAPIAIGAEEENPNPKTPNTKPETRNLKPETRNSKPETSNTIRVSTKKLDNLLFQAEEMLSLKLTSIQQTQNLRNTLNKLNIWNKESSEVFSSVRNVKQSLEKIEKEGVILKEEQEIAKIIQFYEWGVSHIKILEDDLIELRKFSDREAYSSGVKIETLLDDVKEIITVPFSNLLDVFPKTVRDLSKEMGKEIDLSVIGDNTEIDRRILEEIRIPLLHLLRNCIDYGIEKPDIRLSKNKAKKGAITFYIERLENNKIQVLISDDGAGIDIEKLKDIYIKNEKVSAEEAVKISDQELLYYIFRSGISTSEMVTDISGRGLGLAIVQEKIEQFGGSVIVESEKDKGTTFKIELPLSMVTFRGILIKVSDREFVVPTAKVQRALRLNKKEVKTVENKATIPFDGKVIPFVNLSNILELPIKETDSEYVQTLIFNLNNKQIGFAIDEIIDEQEVLVKNFNKHLARIRNISSATVLGSGKVIPILNISDILKSALKPTVVLTKQKVAKETEVVKKSIIVVEDSITSRMLLKNILETAGYEVTTAIDGVDGFTKLKENAFDAVVSDIDMPRMNGFDLTEKIRSDKVLSEIPVVLVTSLSKREDRERGIDIGANAYIIKSSFDQSNLLEILERLI
jgi:two-component system, chemotaxis family, sensor kinase CheA